MQHGQAPASCAGVAVAVNVVSARNVPTPEALRCFKRLLSDVVYRTMIRDSEPSLFGPA
jgi:hypothetical protein